LGNGGGKKRNVPPFRHSERKKRGSSCSIREEGGGSVYIPRGGSEGQIPHLNRKEPQESASGQGGRGERKGKHLPSPKGHDVAPGRMDREGKKKGRMKPGVQTKREEEKRGSLHVLILDRERKGGNFEEGGRGRGILFSKGRRTSNPSPALKREKKNNPVRRPRRHDSIHSLIITLQKKKKERKKGRTLSGKKKLAALLGKKGIAFSIVKKGERGKKERAGDDGELCEANSKKRSAHEIPKGENKGGERNRVVNYCRQPKQGRKGAVTRYLQKGKRAVSIPRSAEGCPKGGESRAPCDRREKATDEGKKRKNNNNGD